MRRIRQCLNAKLAEIYQKALFIEQLNVTLKPYLPESCRPHVSVGSFTNGNLVLITADPLWASQLRYHLPELRDTLRKDAGIYQLASIKISIALNNENTTKTKPRFPPLSTKAREMILSGSEQCDYSPLKSALEHLAKSQKSATAGL